MPHACARLITGRKTRAYRPVAVCPTFAIRRYTVTIFGTTIVFENSTHDCYFGVFSFVRPSCIFSRCTLPTTVLRLRIRGTSGKRRPCPCHATVDAFRVDSAGLSRPYTPLDDLLRKSIYRPLASTPLFWTDFAGKKRKRTIR